MGRNVENLTAEKFESLYTSRRSIFNVVRGYMPTCISTVLLKKKRKKKRKKEKRNENIESTSLMEKTISIFILFRYVDLRIAL